MPPTPATMGHALSIDVQGIPELQRTIGIVRSCFTDWELLWAGFIRPTRAPGGAGFIVDEPFTLEGSVRDAFEKSGVSAYSSSPWEGYGNEPNYAAYKLARGGGTDILVWMGSRSPLSDTFTQKGNRDHVERVSARDFEWGSRRWYARRLNDGGFHQPWDDVRPGPRPIIKLSSRAGFHLAKGAQRIIVGRLKEAGISPGAALRGLRVYP